MIKRVVTAGVLGAVVFSLAACGGDHKSSGNTASTPAPAQAVSTPAAAPAAASEFGVPECDEYIGKYMACIDSKVPEAARGMVRQQLDATKGQWKRAAATPEGRAGLAMACKQASDAAKQAMSAYGCNW